MTDKTAKANVEPVRQRTQYSCMAASMAMCLRALDHDLTEDEVNRVMGARPMKGAAWEQALATAQHYGCRATLTMPSTVEQLKEWTDAGIPVMIAWNPEGRPWSHASVVFDVDDDLNVYVADPNLPNPKKTVRVVSEDDFYGKWYEKFPDYLVRRPACAIAREVSTGGAQMSTLKVAKTARRETPAEIAIWGAWDAFQGVDKVREYDSFDSACEAFFLSVSMEDDLYETPFFRLAEKTLRKVRGLDRQSRSWRSAYNLWESHDIDMTRLVRDLQATLDAVKKVEEHLATMGRIQREFPDVWNSIDHEHGKATSAAITTKAAFTHAIKAVKDHAKAAKKAADEKEARAKRKKKPLSMKDRMKVKKDDSKPRNPHAQDALSRKPTRGHKRKERSRSVGKGHSRKPKHKNQQKYATKVAETMDRLVMAFWRMASIRGDELYFLATDGKWYLEYSHYPWSDDDDDENAARVDDYYGPFASFEAAKKFQRRNLSNTGGFSKDTSGRMKPPSRPINPRGRRRWAGGFWQKMSRDHGWKHVDDEILAYLSWESGYDTVRERKNIPTWNDLTNDGEDFADGQIDDGSAQKLVDQWNRQGWWPRQVKVDKHKLHLLIMHRGRNKAFEARFPAKDQRKAMSDGERAVEIIRGSKYPRWMKPVKVGAYSGNPDGKPIYDVKVDHGEHEALSGGFDVMKRLQERYRVEQGFNGPLDNTPQLTNETATQTKSAARDTPEMQIHGRRVKVNDAFVKRLKQMHRSHILERVPRGGFTLVHPESDKDPNFDGGSEYDFYFRPAKDLGGWWDVVYQIGYLILLQKDGDAMRATTTRLARSSSDTSEKVEA